VYHSQALQFKGLQGFFCPFGKNEKRPGCRKMRVLTRSIAGTVAGKKFQGGVWSACGAVFPATVYCRKTVA